VKGRVTIGNYMRGGRRENKSEKLIGRIINQRKEYNNYLTRGKNMLSNLIGTLSFWTMHLYKYQESENLVVLQT